MHNLSDETFLEEMDSEYGNYELDPEFEFNDEFDQENDYESDSQNEFESDGIQYEIFEMEMAEELLQVENEAEFSSWLKKLGKRAAGAASRLLSSKEGQNIVRSLSGIASKTLPIAGGAIGSYVGGKVGSQIGGNNANLIGRGIGHAIGRGLGQKAGNAAANAPAFVRFAANTLKNISKEFELTGSINTQRAILNSARKNYPIILNIKGTLTAKSPSSNKREFEFSDEMESDFEMETDFEFGESLEMEFASDLLNVNNEAELDQFLGKLIKRAGGAVRNFARSSTGKALGGMLKGLAKKALPIAGGAIGNFIVPGLGGAIGSKLGSMAGNLFELELEGLSPEDQEFELARAYVRFAGNAVRRASRLNPNGGPNIARRAIYDSASRYAPGLVRRPYKANRWDSDRSTSRREQGMWYRQGNTILIKGL